MPANCLKNQLLEFSPLTPERRRKHLNLVKLWQAGTDRIAILLVRSGQTAWEPASLLDPVEKPLDFKQGKNNHLEVAGPQREVFMIYSLQHLLCFQEQSHCLSLF